MTTWIIVAIGALMILARASGSSSGGSGSSSGSSSSSYIYADRIGKGGNCSDLSKYASIYRAAGAAYGMDWRWLAAQGCIESGYNPQAISVVGAAGIAQFLPATARDMGLNVAPGVQYRGREFPTTLDPMRDQRFNPALAIPAQARYLKRFWNRYRSMPLVFACYRSGPGRVADRIAAGGTGLSDGDQRYFDRITARYNQIG